MGLYLSQKRWGDDSCKIFDTPNFMHPCITGMCETLGSIHPTWLRKISQSLDAVPFGEQDQALSAAMSRAVADRSRI